MSKLTKKAKALQGKVDSNKLYPIADALSIVKDAATAKFDESIDVAVQLGIDAKKSDQVVRGAVVLPNGTGKTKRVAVFAQGAKAEEAKAAGADIVGMDDLAAEIKAGKMNFDVVIASPDTMRVVGTLGQILGPRGLMPNPKVGTVTADVAKAVRDAKAGQVQFRVDKAGIVHATIGRRSFESDKLHGQPARADRCAEQVQAGQQQGCVPAQGGGVVDDGRGRPCGHHLAGGDGLSSESKAVRWSWRAAARSWWAARPARNAQVIQDRWCGHRSFGAGGGLIGRPSTAACQRRWRSRRTGCVG